MKRRDKFDYVLVETTGLADPGPVAQTFFMDDEIQNEFTLDGMLLLLWMLRISINNLEDLHESKSKSHLQMFF